MNESPNNDVKKICMTPVRNEAWIIKQFLAAAKLWADQVIVADQGSTDGTVENVRSTPGIKLIVNESTALRDNNHRQQLLISAARQTPGKRILFGLDVDETLSANSQASSEWEQICNARPGTILRFHWVNVLPGFQKVWIPPGQRAFGFVDDGSEHRGARTHSPRVPQPPGAPVLDLEEIVVLHFQYLAWERMLSKHRWYQAWEWAVHRERSAIEIFREYHHMYGSWDKGEIHPVKEEWLGGYDRAGIDFRSLKSEPVTWCDEEVIQMLREHGPEHFRKIAIWDKNWTVLASQLGTNGVDFSDPRSFTEKVFHRLLMATQGRRSNLAVRGFEKFLRALGW